MWTGNSPAARITRVYHPTSSYIECMYYKASTVHSIHEHLKRTNAKDIRCQITEGTSIDLVQL